MLLTNVHIHRCKELSIRNVRLIRDLQRGRRPGPGISTLTGTPVGRLAAESTGLKNPAARHGSAVAALHSRISGVHSNFWSWNECEIVLLSLL